MFRYSKFYFSSLTVAVLIWSCKPPPQFTELERVTSRRVLDELQASRCGKDAKIEILEGTIKGEKHFSVVLHSFNCDRIRFGKKEHAVKNNGVNAATFPAPKRSSSSSVIEFSYLTKPSIWYNFEIDVANDVDNAKVKLIGTELSSPEDAAKKTSY